MEKKSAQGPQNEIWWKAIFLSNLCNFLKKNETCCDWQVVFFISEGFEDFLNPRLSLIVKFNSVCISRFIGWTMYGNSEFPGGKSYAYNGGTILVNWSPGSAIKIPQVHLLQLHSCANYTAQSVIYWKLGS